VIDELDCQTMNQKGYVHEMGIGVMAIADDARPRLMKCLFRLIRRHLRSMAGSRNSSQLFRKKLSRHRGADLVGAVIFKTGDNLPTVVVLHTPEAATRGRDLTAIYGRIAGVGFCGADL